MWGTNNIRPVGRLGQKRKPSLIILSLLYTQTNQQPNNLSQVEREKKTKPSDWKIADSSDITNSQQRSFNLDSNSGNTVVHYNTTDSSKLWQRYKQRYWQQVSKWNTINLHAAEGPFDWWFSGGCATNLLNNFQYLNDSFTHSVIHSFSHSTSIQYSS